MNTVLKQELIRYNGLVVVMQRSLKGVIMALQATLWPFTATP